MFADVMTGIYVKKGPTDATDKKNLKNSFDFI
jgi:hypothetical protein